MQPSQVGCLVDDADVTVNGDDAVNGDAGTPREEKAYIEMRKITLNLVSGKDRVSAQPSKHLPSAWRPHWGRIRTLSRCIHPRNSSLLQSQVRLIFNKLLLLCFLLGLFNSVPRMTMTMTIISSLSLSF